MPPIDRRIQTRSVLQPMGFEAAFERMAGSVSKFAGRSARPRRTQIACEERTIIGAHDRGAALRPRSDASRQPSETSGGQAFSLPVAGRTYRYPVRLLPLRLRPVEPPVVTARVGSLPHTRIAPEAVSRTRRANERTMQTAFV